MLRKNLRRIGCALLVIPWLIVMFAPCFVIALVSQGEIRITWSDVPDDAFRIWLLQESRLSGLGIATARRVLPATQATFREAACTIIDVRFWVWQGDAERAGALPSHQCACYYKESADEAWQVLSVGDEACRLAGE